MKKSPKTHTLPTMDQEGSSSDLLSSGTSGSYGHSGYGHGGGGCGCKGKDDSSVLEDLALLAAGAALAITIGVAISQAAGGGRRRRRRRAAEEEGGLVGWDKLEFVLNQGRKH